MEELLNLLREYIRLKYEYREYGAYLNKKNKLILESQHYFIDYGMDEEWYTDEEFGESIIISKQFGFIKWLVDNDKIDKKKIDTRLVKYVESHYDEEGYWMENSYEDYSDINTLLMLLAISDTPIDDLISYLK